MTMLSGIYFGESPKCGRPYRTHEVVGDARRQVAADGERAHLGLPRLVRHGRHQGGRQQLHGRQRQRLEVGCHRNQETKVYNVMDVVDDPASVYGTAGRQALQIGHYGGGGWCDIESSRTPVQYEQAEAVLLALMRADCAASAACCTSLDCQEGQSGQTLERDRIMTHFPGERSYRLAQRGGEAGGSTAVECLFSVNPLPGHPSYRTPWQRGRWRRARTTAPRCGT